MESARYTHDDRQRIEVGGGDRTYKHALQSSDEWRLPNSGSGANVMMNVMNPAVMASSPRYLALTAMGTASQVFGSTPSSDGRSNALLPAFAAEAKAVVAALK